MNNTFYYFIYLFICLFIHVTYLQDTICCICKGNYKFYCSWRWAYKPETCRAKINKYLHQVGNWLLYLGSIFTEDGKNKEDIIQRIKEAKVTFNNKKQLLCSNNLSLEIKKNLTKSCIWCVALYESETWTLQKNEERDVNALEKWSRKRMLKIKWTDKNNEWRSFSKGERRKTAFKNLKKIDPTHG